MPADLIETLPHVNASLNALATMLLIVGWILIKRQPRQERAHMCTMLACFGISVLFLGCYLTYHYYAGSKKFPTDTNYAPLAARYTYYGILLTHVVLAAAVPFLAIATIYTGLADYRRIHVRLAKLTFPIWLYVSVTGVIVYLMLYQLYRPVA